KDAQRRGPGRGREAAAAQVLEQDVRRPRQVAELVSTRADERRQVRRIARRKVLAEQIGRRLLRVLAVVGTVLDGVGGVGGDVDIEQAVAVVVDGAERRDEVRQRLLR